MTTLTNLEFVLGETWVIDFALDDAADAALDLTGGTVKFRLSRRGVLLLELTSSTADVSFDSPPTLGTGTITVEPADQAALVPAVYDYEVRATLADGSVTTQASGSLAVSRTLF
jgi:hypothetical protein